jgi:predicted acetyltransferase
MGRSEMGRNGNAGAVVVRQPQDHELDALASVVEDAFMFRFSPEERERFLAGIEPARSLVVAEGPAIVGTLLSYLTELTVPGPVLAPVAALTDIAVSPTKRGRGHLGRLLGRFFLDAHKRGEHLALLDASEGGLYGRYGFGPATWSATYRLARGTPRLASAEVTGPGDLVVLRADEARASLPAVFEDWRRSSVGEVPRAAPAWDELLEQDKASGRARFVVVHAPAGLIDSYAIYDARPNGHELSLHLVELVAGSDAGYRELWRYLVALAGAGGLESGPRPTEEAARHLLGDVRALFQQELRDRSWLRLLDVAAALDLRRYQGAGALRCSVRDEQCPWNAGSFVLEVDADGHAEVTPTKRAADLELSAADLATAYLGAKSFATLVRAGRVLEVTSGAAVRADRLFGADRPPFQSAEL